MKVQHYAGIDPAKCTFTVAVWPYGDKSQELCHEFSNCPGGYQSLKYWLSGHGISSIELLCCVEHTGLYSGRLALWLFEQGVHVWQEMPLAIKRAGGLQRGKTDPLDARRIAAYCLRNQDQARLWEPPSQAIETLNQLVRARERLIQVQSQLSVPVKELRACGYQSQAQLVSKANRAALEGMEQSVAVLEQLIDELLIQDTQLNRKYELLRTVPGFGKITACELLCYTRGFTKFDNPRQLACYCGVAPFEHSSGTSVFQKPRVSHMANKRLKKLLHLAALRMIREDNDLTRYYHRKVEQGKNKMLVLNAIRNKLLHRAMAVVTRGTPYVPDLN